MDPFSQYSCNPSFFDSSSSFTSMTNIHINYSTGQEEEKKKNYKKKKTTNNVNNIKLGAKDAAVKLSTDPQSIAARERRHRISERFKILQSLIPGGAKLDTVSMLEEAIQYVKFLKSQIWLHQNMINLVVSSSSSSCSDGDHHHHHHDCMINGYDHLHPHQHQHQPPPQLQQQLQMQQMDFSIYEEDYYFLVDQMEAMLPDQHHQLMYP